MKFLANVCTVLGFALLGMGILLILTGIVGIWKESGVSGVREVMNPFNIANFILMMLVLAPGVGLLMLSGTLKNKVGQGK